MIADELRRQAERAHRGLAQALVTPRNWGLARSGRCCTRNQRQSCLTLVGFPCALRVWNLTGVFFSVVVLVGVSGTAILAFAGPPMNYL
jgi:hypothetical protein